MKPRRFPRPTRTFTVRDAAISWARAFNTLDSSHISRWLDDEVRYTSQWLDGEIDSRESYLEYLDDKLRTIRESTIVARAELAETKGGADGEESSAPCVVVDLRGEPLATVLFEVEACLITRIEFCMRPSPDACVRQGVCPGLTSPSSGILGGYWH